jgi:hypothetical protein
MGLASAFILPLSKMTLDLQQIHLSFIIQKDQILPAKPITII